MGQCENILVLEFVVFIKLCSTIIDVCVFGRHNLWQKDDAEEEAEKTLLDCSSV